MPARPRRERTPEQQAAFDEFQRRPNPLIGLDGFDSQIERNPSGERTPPPRTPPRSTSFT